MRVFLAALLMFGLAAPAFAGEQKAVELKRVGKWQLDYNKDSCQLFARFGTGTDEIIARFVRYDPGNGFDLSLFGKPVGFNGDGRPKETSIAFGGNKELRVKALAGSSADNIPMLMFNSLRLDGWSAPNSNAAVVAPAIAPEFESAIKTITVKVPFGKRYRLVSGELGSPMAAMRACTDDLVKSWGYDPAALKLLKQTPVPLTRPGNWLRSEDYPPGSLNGGHNGIVQVRVDVDENGGVAGCHILHKTEPDDFAALSCKLIAQRARFSPALDAAGKPARSYFTTKIFWLVSL